MSTIEKSLRVLIVYEAVGVKVRSMHHDISTVTGEEVIVFSFEEIPRFE